MMRTADHEIVCIRGVLSHHGLRKANCYLGVVTGGRGLPGIAAVVLSLEEVRQSGGAFVITVLGIGASVGAIRGGTLLAFGSFAHRRWNLYAQVAVGVASGVGVITALFVISGVFPEPLP